MHLAKETNRFLPRLRKSNTEIAIPKIVDKCTINGIRYVGLIVLLVLVKCCNRKPKINIIHKRRSQHYVKCSPIVMDSKTRENKQWASHIRQEEIQNRVRSTRCKSVKATPTPGPAPSSFNLDFSNTSQ